jgi:IS30 family transposase
VDVVDRFSEAEKAEIWDALERGEAVRAIGRALGRCSSSIRTYLIACEGRRPRPPGSSELRLSLREREEIPRGLAAGESLRRVAAGLGRAPSTISREVAVNGGRRAYRALSADRAARRRCRRPKPAKLAVNLPVVGKSDVS